jgi:ABC-type amino acid transport substrate-binding protein
MVAWTNGLRRVEDLGGNSVAFARSTGQYQLTELARAKKCDLAAVKLQQMPSEGEVARAVAQHKVRAALLPSAFAHELMVASQAHLIGWYSDIGRPAARRLVCGEQDARDSPWGRGEIRAPIAAGPPIMPPCCKLIGAASAC